MSRNHKVRGLARMVTFMFHGSEVVILAVAKVVKVFERFRTGVLNCQQQRDPTGIARTIRHAVSVVGAKLFNTTTRSSDHCPP